MAMVVTDVALAVMAAMAAMVVESEVMVAVWAMVADMAVMAVESAADMEVLEDTEEDTEDVALADMVMADADITVRNRQAKSTVRSSHHCCTM